MQAIRFAYQIKTSVGSFIASSPSIRVAKQTRVSEEGKPFVCVKFEKSLLESILLRVIILHAFFNFALF
jgi:hypothetical protein